MQSAFEKYQSIKKSKAIVKKKETKTHKSIAKKIKTLRSTNLNQRAKKITSLMTALKTEVESPQERERSCGQQINDDEIEEIRGKSRTISIDRKFFEKPEKVFQYLISPLAMEDFFNTKWGKIPIRIKRNNSEYYQRILTTRKLQSMFLDNVLMYTRNVDLVSYVNNQMKTYNLEGRALPTTLWHYYKKGCTIRVLNPHTYCSKLHSLLAYLQEYFGCSVSVNARLTPPGSQGFAPNYDDFETFVLQLEGRSHWKLYSSGESLKLPTRLNTIFNQDELRRTPTRDVTLETGDLLYLPHGKIHENFTDRNEHSLYITISVYKKCSYLDLMEHLIKSTLAKAASEQVEFREGLPLQYLRHIGFANSNSNSAESLELRTKVKNLLTKMIDYIDVDSGLDQLGKQFMWDSVPPVPSKEEKINMMISNSEKIVDGKICNSVNIDLDVEVRLLRYHCLKLVKEDDYQNNVRIYYNTDNAKYYHGEDLQFLIVDIQFTEAIKRIINAYPNFVKVESLPLENDADKMQIVSDLWERGLLVTKTPLQTDDE